MSSGITFSGFNNIDWSMILNAVMTQESQPLYTLQSQQSSLKSKQTNLTSLTTKLGTLESAASVLSNSARINTFAATSSDTAALGVSSGSGAMEGRYEIIVNQLARAQVTASGTTADADTTVIASGGTFTIGGATITLAGDTTLRGLADQINAATDSPARASVVQSGPGAFRLVLTARDTGAANGFTVTNGMTGGAGLTFTDTDGNGVIGDSVEDNAVAAMDADLLVNNIAVTSASNTLTEAVPGTTLTLYRQDPTKTVVVDVATDTTALKKKVEDYVTAYNAVVDFISAQTAAAAKSDATSIGHDPVVREVRNALRSGMTGAVAGSTDFPYLSQVGLEFTRTGKLQLDSAKFDDAFQNNPEGLTRLFAGNGTDVGAFGALKATLTSFTTVGGVLGSAQDQLKGRITRMDTQILDLQDRLAVRRAALQKEYLAAETAMSQLTNQSGALANLSA